jgi:hypothetical protein
MGWKLVRQDEGVSYYLDDPSDLPGMDFPVFYIRAVTPAPGPRKPLVGEMEVEVREGVAGTRWIESRGPRGARIGTKMYEIAASYTCEKYGVPLRSGALNEMSLGFWEKQLSLGRARWLGPGSYTLSCPAPASLSGRRR